MFKMMDSGSRDRHRLGKPAGLWVGRGQDKVRVGIFYPVKTLAQMPVRRVLVGSESGDWNSPGAVSLAAQ